MTDQELKNLWQLSDEKLNHVISLNQKQLFKMTKSKLNQKVNRMRAPKSIWLLIGLIYTFILLMISIISLLTGAYVMSIGFGTITFIMSYVLVSYIHQLFLIRQIKKHDSVILVQRHVSKLKISSFNCIRIMILQLPFWSLAFVSIKALVESPLLYGGVNLLIFLCLAIIAVWLYTNLDMTHPQSKVSQFFLSGDNWDALQRTIALSEELTSYKNQA